MRILIVDDERLIRSSIRVMLNRLNIDDSCIVEADSAFSMLEILTSTPIDLALVDIKMPLMNGLDAVEQANQISPRTRFYILTGFSEFEYARRALKLKVIDYLLKPLSEASLESILKLTEENMKLAKQEHKALIKQYINAIVYQMEEEDLEYLRRPEGIVLILLVCVDGQHLDGNREWGSEEFISNRIRSASLPAAVDMTTVRYDKNKWVVTLSVQSQEPGLLTEKLEEVFTGIELETPKGTATIFISRHCRDTGEFIGTLNKMNRLAPIRVMEGVGKVYYADRMDPSHEELLSISSMCMNLEDSHRLQRPIEFKRELQNLVQHLSQGDTFSNQAYKRNLLRFFHVTLGLNTAEITDVEELQQALLECAGNDQASPAGNTSLMNAILAYINENYSEGISLNLLSQKFNLSPNYLSVLFQQHTEEKFINYVTRLRMTEAKRLLVETEMSVKDIASTIGYYSASHFIRIFVKQNRCTPAEYRRM